MFSKINNVSQEYNITTARLSVFDQTVTYYFLGIKIYRYVEKHSEKAVKEEANNIGFRK